ncbi:MULTISPECIES: hypothetical protein [Nguyenibacter]|uniref:DUF4136 domain-containing protein n=1 Tax=Nguyenibacter vanlangensis TaxID=1216886 RepID=A0A7Y7M3Y0_9PROT|nr:MULTISPECIES: hypothetical protein [Nguyenibacter]NVN10165.1 hypothetical protein [Nguyenibacter vanlangensis]WRH86557.1 hypothetical protein QN315_11015 [Nguyenibacter sp. L1]
MTYARFLPLAALLAFTACEVPSPEQRALLNAMLDRPAVDVVRQFGVPTRVYQADGHTFLAYISYDTNYYYTGGGWGWYGRWGGPGWGPGWGWGGPWWDGAYVSTCQTTFELFNDKVTAWTMRGDGC